MEDFWSILRVAVIAAYMLALVFSMSNFKCGAKTARLAYAAVLAVAAVFNALLYGLEGREVMMRWFAVSIAVPCLAVLLLLSRDHFPQLVFNFFTAVNALYLVSVIGLTISGNERIWLDILIRAVLFSVILYLFHRYFNTPYRFLGENMQGGWWVISFIPFLFFSMVMFLGMYPAMNTDNFFSVVLLYLILCCVYVVIYQVFYNTYALISQKQTARMLSMQLTMQKEQFAMQKQSMEQMKVLRHDMRHYNQNICALLQQNRPQDALEFAGRFNERLAQTTPPHYCDNSTLNAILSFYIGKAEGSGITCQHSLALPEDLPVDTVELSTVFANAIDNAINACNRQPEGEPRLLTITAVSSPQLVIDIANTFSGEIRFNSDGLPEAAEPGHGIGSRSIAAFAREHHAVCHYKAKDRMFHLYLLIP